MKKWNSNKVLRELVRCYNKGYTAKDIRNKRWDLYKASIKYFESFKGAIEAAGLKPSNFKMVNSWNEEKIKAAIKKLISSGSPLNYKHMYDYHGGILQTAEKYFGSWNNTLKIMGFDPETVKKKGKWDKVNSKSKILQMFNEGQDISPTGLNSKLYQELVRTYDSYKRALKEFGIPYKKAVKNGDYITWSKNLIIKKLKDRKKKGLPLYVNQVKKDDNKLFNAAMAYFENSWGDAVEAAGFNYEEEKGDIDRIDWDHELITSEIKRLYDNGEEVNSHYSQKNHSRLYHAGARIFGSWEQAITASGLDYLEINKNSDNIQWDQHKVINDIQSLHEKSVDLGARYTQIHNHKLLSAAKSKFGTWEKAITAAGLDYSKIVRKKGFGKATRGKDDHIYASKTEAMLANIFLDNNIDFKPHYRFLDHRKMTVDFLVYAPRELFVEYDGLQGLRKWNNYWEGNNEKINLYIENHYDYVILIEESIYWLQNQELDTSNIRELLRKASNKFLNSDIAMSK